MMRSHMDWIPVVEPSFPHLQLDDATVGSYGKPTR